jgi:transposase
MSQNDVPEDRVAQVLKLALVDGVSIRAISKRLSMARKTVRRIMGKRQARGAPGRPEPVVRHSLLAPHEPEIRRLLEETPELKAPAVLDRLRAQGYQGGITILRDHLRSVRPRPSREAFLTQSHPPGRILQVDWGDFGFALPGCPRRVSAFVAALAYSRYLYLEFVLSQSMGSFLRCMDRALRFFGGRTSLDVFDNMKTVVKERTRTATVFNHRFAEYAAVRGFAYRACNPGRGNEKPYVERPIGFMRTRFWPGRRFSDLLDLNVQATRWRDDIANNRVNEGTGKVPALVFKHEEQSLLGPLLEAPFETDDLLSAGVTKTFRVTFDRNVYSVPWRLIGQSLLVRADDERVRLFLGPKLVAVHPRSWAVGEQVVDTAHEEGVLAGKPRAAGGLLPPGLEGLGDTGAAYFKVLAANGGSIRRETLRLVLLAELFGEPNTAEAMDHVMRTGHVGADYIEYVLRHHKGLEASQPPLRLGRDDLDSLALSAPDLTGYDRPSRTLDPGPVPSMPPAIGEQEERP